MYICIYIHIYIYIYVYIHTYIHTYIYIYNTGGKEGAGMVVVDSLAVGDKCHQVHSSPSMEREKERQRQRQREGEGEGEGERERERSINQGAIHTIMFMNGLHQRSK